MSVKVSYGGITLSCSSISQASRILGKDKRTGRDRIYDAKVLEDTQHPQLVDVPTLAAEPTVTMPIGIMSGKTWAQFLEHARKEAAARGL